MKKALFKPSSKVYENFEYSKLQEMLLQKINYFYKQYIRYLKRMNSISDNSKVYEFIKKDIEDFENSGGFDERNNLTCGNLSEKCYDEMDMKNLMIVDFFRSLKGKNPFLKQDQGDSNMQRLLSQDESENQVTNNYSEDYYTFNELSLKEKVEVLFFFCNYALSFSGRAPFFKEELVKESKDPISQIAKNKRIKPLGTDSEKNVYYTLHSNKDCKIYIETTENKLDLIAKNYEELEKLITKFENSNENLILKNIKDNLLIFKENDDEEKKEAAFSRKQQALEKAKKINSKLPTEIEKYHQNDYFLMNISDHVTTRNQLNQITKTNITINKPQAPQIVVTEDERKKQKVEKEKLERQRRLEKRNRLINNEDESSSNFSSNKRHRTSGRDSNKNIIKANLRSRKKIKRKFESSEDEFDYELESQHLSNEIPLESDREEDIEVELMDNNRSNVNLYQEEEREDIVLEGNLIYRYSNNQIELDGNWFINNDNNTKERLSFLFMKSTEFTECIIDKESIYYENSKSNMNDFKIKICAANIFECLLINDLDVFQTILDFLSGEYAGYFMYYGKTIEDRVCLNLTYQDSLVRINGKHIIYFR